MTSVINPSIAANIHPVINHVNEFISNKKEAQGLF
jgi:hypothetical protein